MTLGYSVSLTGGSNLLDLERITWGPGSLAPLIAFGPDITAASTTPSLPGQFLLVGANILANSATFSGAVSGTLVQATASWGNGNLIVYGSGVPYRE
jgi:hypothetical protein